MIKVKGIGVSSGIAKGNVFVKKEKDIQISHENIKDEDIYIEIQRIDNAKEKCVIQLKKLYDSSKEKIGKKEAEIFFSHLMMIEDKEFTDKIKNIIKNKKNNAEYALKQVEREYVNTFENMDNEYLRERVKDIKDISMRMLKALVGIDEEDFSDLEDKVIIIAKDLTPSDTANIDKQKVLGFITEMGGTTSHTAIIAKSIQIPAVVGVDDILNKVNDGDELIIDGEEGEIFINPDEKTIQIYLEKQKQYIDDKEKLKLLKGQKNITKDGVEYKVFANIANVLDVENAIENDAQGVGLFRTEFLFMNRNDFPSEQYQFEAYKTVVEKMQNKDVIIRTLDIGGDKNLKYLNIKEEMNPFLGCRAIRFCLKNEDIFLTQLRAILKASAYGSLKIMFPMISTIEELSNAKQILEKAKQSLIEQNIKFNKNVQVGMMIETPAAAILADLFAKEVDFFSIGTNDLIQYTMTADRLNKNVSYLYDKYNPSVLRLIKNIIDSAHKEKILVGMCGETASDDKLIPLFIGMGLDEFSVSPSYILKVRQIIKSTKEEETKNMIQQIMYAKTSNEVKNILTNVSIKPKYC